MSESTHPNGGDDDVFLYTAGSDVPIHVVHVRVDPSVTVIPEKAFSCRFRLAEVELCEGLQVIEFQAFHACMQCTKTNHYPVLSETHSQECLFQL